MKTESNPAHRQAAASQSSVQPADLKGNSSSGPCPMPSAYPGMADFGRAALGLLDDIASLFDPASLLFPPQPVKARTVHALPHPAAHPAAPPATLRERADAAPTEEEFQSRPSALISTPRHGATGEPRPIRQHISISDAKAVSDSKSATLSTIASASIDTLDDVLLPVRGGNAALARALLPPTAFCGMQRTPAQWRVSQLRGFLDDGQWQEAARHLSNHTPQRAVALALASCPVRVDPTSFDREVAGNMDRESKGSPGWRMDSLIVAPATTRPEGLTPFAVRIFPDRQAAAVVGSTFHAATAGTRMDCQDGVYLSPHCTVVTDGLGGHGEDNVVRRIRVAQVATGQLVTHLVEAIARTEARPAEFLRRHMHSLLWMMDHAVASALVSPWPERDRAQYVGGIEARAAFVAVAHLRDGTVAFGVGDCTAQLFARENDGSLRVVTFIPQPGELDAGDVGGLGQCGLREGQFAVRPFPPGVVERIIVGSDGVFNAHQGHLALVAGRTPATQPTQPEPSTEAPVRAQVGQHDLAEKTPIAACDAIITPLTERTRAYWAAQQGQERPGVKGLDDVALVVRDFKKSS